MPTTRIQKMNKKRNYNKINGLTFGVNNPMNTGTRTPNTHVNVLNRPNSVPE